MTREGNNKIGGYDFSYHFYEEEFRNEYYKVMVGNHLQEELTHHFNGLLLLNIGEICNFFLCYSI